MHLSHKWVLVAAVQGKYVEGGSCTIILYKCLRCTKFKTEAINGHWPLEKILGDTTKGGDGKA